MRILVLNYEFPPVGGGGGRASEELAKALADRGHELRIVTSRASNLPKRERRNGLQIMRVATGRRTLYRASFTSMARYVVAGLRPSLENVRSWNPDLVHAHFAVPTGALAYALNRLTRVPYVLTVHLGDVPGGVPEKTDRWFRLVGPFTGPVWEGATAVVAVSDYTRELARRRYDVPIDVIPNGLSLPPEPDYVPHHPIRLIFAGRFQPQKNLPFLIDALGALAHQQWRCMLIGDGPDMGAVQERVQAHGLEERIELPGWLKEEQVANRLETSDVLVMPSLSEGLPVMGVQALANGLAIAASEAGGLAELVEDGRNGRLSKVGDLDAFVAALDWVIGDVDRLAELKRASRAKAADYDIDRVAAEYESIFRTASRSAASSPLSLTR